jgi:hypothetical protein
VHPSGITGYVRAATALAPDEDCVARQQHGTTLR